LGLTALCVGTQRGWAPRAEVAARVRTTLHVLASRTPHERGWFHHFANTGTGAREWKCELSSIDTALLLAGVLTARQYFAGDPVIVRDATTIYERVDFTWMLNGHPIPSSYRIISSQ
jgi:hypothetical protein